MGPLTLGAVVVTLLAGQIRTDNLFQQPGVGLGRAQPVQEPTLLEAVQKKDLKLLQRLLEHGLNPDPRGAGTEPPLRAACTLKHFPMVKLLLDFGARPLAECEAWSPESKAALEQAKKDARLLGLCGGSDAEQVKQALREGARVNARRNDGARCVLTAATSGDLAIVKVLLKAGGQPSADALDAAIDLGNDEVGEALVRAGAPVAARKPESDPPLHMASKRGLVKTMGALLDRDAPVDGRGASRQTPLIFAVDGEQLAAATLLLARRANPNTAAAEQQTPLMVAATRGNLGLVRLLLARGASASAKDSNGVTVLCFALQSDKPEVVEALLDAKAGVGGTCFDGSPLAAAAARGYAGAVAKLLARGAKVEGGNVYQDTPLALAAQAGHLDVVKLLLDKGADPLRLNDSGRSALSRALEAKQDEVAVALRRGMPLARFAELAERGDAEAVHWLLQRGADPNALGDQHRPVLMSAAMKGHAAVVEALLAAGADPNRRSDDTQGNALTWARSVPVLKALLAKGAKVDVADNTGETALHSAAAEGRLEDVRLLLDSGAEVDHRDNGKMTPLMRAASASSPEVVALLIERGAKVDAIDDGGRFALLNAHVCAKVLLDKGADPNQVMPGNFTSLMRAARDKQPEPVRLLLAHGAKLETVYEKNGFTALAYAVQSRWPEGVALLLEKGADRTVTVKSGQSLADLANGDLRILALITRGGADAGATTAPGR